MPKSKRNKLVSLTKTKKKGRSAKEELVSSVQSALDTYSRTFALSFESMRTGPFKRLQNTMRDSKYVCQCHCVGSSWARTR